MRRSLDLEAFADLVGATPDDVLEVKEAGLLDPDEDGVFDEFDVLRYFIVQSAREGGRPLEDLADEVRSGTDVGGRLFRSGERYTHEEGAERLGLDANVFERLRAAVGTGVQYLDEEDVRMLAAGREMIDLGFPVEAMLEGARVYSDVFRRLTDTEMRMTHRYFCEPMASQGMSSEQVTSALFAFLEVIEPLADQLARHMLSDHRLRSAAEHAVEHAEMARRGSDPSREAAVLFADLASYTTLAAEGGDEIAARVMDEVDTTVREFALRHHGSLVKQIGDAFMLTFSDPADAALFAIDLQQRARTNDEIPSVRIGVHAGEVLYRLGDYVGTTVNIASRVASMAQADAILVTDPVASAATEAGITVEEVGMRRLRGMDEPLAVHRIVGRKHLATDPVCGTEVADAAATLRHEGAELAFCSEKCLRAFLDRPDDYPAFTGPSSPS